MIAPDNTLVMVKTPNGAFRCITNLVSVELQRNSETGRARFSLSREASGQRLSQAISGIAAAPLTFRVVYRDADLEEVLAYDLRTAWDFEHDTLRLEATPPNGKALDEVVYCVDFVIEPELEGM
jgi:hypothetical protein